MVAASGPPPPPTVAGGGALASPDPPCSRCVCEVLNSGLCTVMVCPPGPYGTGGVVGTPVAGILLCVGVVGVSVVGVGGVGRRLGRAVTFEDGVRGGTAICR